MRAGRYLWLLLLLAATVCRKWDNPFDPANSRAPYAPSEPFPDSNASAIDTGVVLRWTGGDPDTVDTVIYDVYFGPTASPALDDSGLTVTQYRVSGLQTYRRYYWQVEAHDNRGKSTTGPLWTFQTGAANRPPSAPVIVSPDTGAAGLWNRPTLVWTCADPDTGDTVFYDVYVGPATPPPLVAQKQRQKSYTPAGLLYDTVQYWRIVAYDHKGAQSTGPVWWFRTAPSVGISVPNDSTRWPVGSQQTILWSGGPAVPPGDSTLVYYSTNGGTSWSRHGRASVVGQYSWRVPGPVSTAHRVQVRLYVGADTNQSLSPRYTVTDTAPPSPITLTSPTGGLTWLIGSIHDITWTGGTFGMDSTVIFYSTNAGASWARQGKTTTPGSYKNWVVPGPATSAAKVRVRAYSLTRYTDGQSASFTVSEPPYPDTVLATVTVGARPVSMVWDSLDNRVFCANYSDSSVSVIDGATNQVLRTIHVGQFPCAVCWNSANNRVYVANQGGNTVSVINAATYAVEATLPVGSSPRALCWNGTGNKVYVANRNSADVTVIDGAANSVRGTVRADTSPYAVGWVPSVNRVYVANFARNSVTVISGTTDSVSATVGVGYAPCALAVDPNNNVAVPNQNAGSVTIINSVTNAIRATVNCETQPWAACANRTGSRLFVANSGAGSVTVINTATYVDMQSVATGAQPRSLGWSDLVDKVYVANYDGSSVAILSGTTGNRLKTVSVGSRPTAVTLNRANNRVYVANYDDGTVSVIGTTAR